MKFLLFFFFFIPDLHPKLLSYAIIITPTHYTLFLLYFNPRVRVCLYSILYPSILSPRARAGVLSPFLCAFFFSISYFNLFPRGMA